MFHKLRDDKHFQRSSFTVLLLGLIFPKEERKIAREYHYPPPCKTVIYANEVHQPKLTGNFCRFLKTLINNTHCEYSIRCHERSSHSETEDVCSPVSGEHYHILFYIKSFIGTEKFIKANLSEQMLKPPKIPKSRIVMLSSAKFLTQKVVCNLNFSFLAIVYSSMVTNSSKCLK